jgi:hypothetical protein
MAMNESPSQIKTDRERRTSAIEVQTQAGQSINREGEKVTA